MTEALEQLLTVQGHDLRLTQLATKRIGLPERKEAADLAAAVVALDAEAATVGAERHRLDRDQTRLDDEVESLKAKSAQADKALYSGAVTNPRELQSLQDEVAALARRIGELEDSELEIMVEREPFDEKAAELAGQREALVAQAETVARRITVAEAEIDAESEAETQARAAAAEAVEADLLAEYEKIRRTAAGIGVARLHHGTCQGCHMKLSAVELDRIRSLPADTRIHCEECGRLLVR